MNTVVLLGSKYPGEKNSIDLLKDLPNQDVSFKYIYWEDLIFTIALNEQSIINAPDNFDLKNADLIIAFNWYRSSKDNLYRDTALSTALYLKDNNVPFWNEEMVNQRSSSKLSALMFLALIKIDIPRTIFSLNSDLLLKSAKESQVILKSALANRGKDNYLINDPSEIKKYLNFKASNKFIIQEYIPNKFDLRIVCLNSKPGIIIKRTRVSNQTHLNNTSRGAKAELVNLSDLDSDIKSECQTICQKMGRNIAGIDLIYSTDSDRHVYLEVNSLPQLTSGTFTNEKRAAILNSIKEALGI